jgi:hypothetical protein
MVLKYVRCKFLRQVENTYRRNKPVKVTLKVHYTDDYPQSIPELSLEPINTEFTDAETDQLLQGLRNVVSLDIYRQTSPSDFVKGEENIGMAMTFTLVSHLREHLARLLQGRIEKRKKEEQEKERLELEVWLHVWGRARQFELTFLHPR